jgi:hypothetical protein
MCRGADEIHDTSREATEGAMGKKAIYDVAVPLTYSNGTHEPET